MTAVTEQIHDIGRRRAWVIWLVALSVYILAIFNRSSLGVAGLLATQRFGISATQLSFFTVLQLVVYAGLQVPIGVLLDRYGSKLLLLCGLILMTVGQLVFALATSFPVAVLARVLIGAGDAAMFVSVIRLVTVWFLVRQAPMITQLTGQLGQVGAIAAAAPLALALDRLGWTKAFALASTLGVFGMVAVALMVKDSPYARTEVVRVKMRALARTLRLVWGNPGTRLGMWSHFTAQFSVTVFVLLWGYPFLVRGEGLSSGAASALLMMMTLWTIVVGLALGTMVSRYPFYRSWMVLGIVAAMAFGWAVVLARSTPAPVWMLVVLACLMATGGPASMVGFDLARTFIPVEASGRANGLVNIGGFSASLLTMGLIGVVLDRHSGGGGSGTYDLDDFRVAMSVQFVFWAFGAVQILRYRHKAISHLQRLHPGAVDALKRGEPVAHLGFNEREGV
jgi:nitrate/nitrite transporter NarK